MDQQQIESHLQQQQHQLRMQVSQQQSQASLPPPPQQQPQQPFIKIADNGVSKTPDRSKRDEWSEEAVGTLLDAYESKWLMRNRAKLKGNDWEDVARQVSTRSSGSKSMKTQSQCKNKIESMKKRYRSEAASSSNPGSGPSTWPFFSRMDGLLRCSAMAQTRVNGTCLVDPGGQPALTDLGMQALPKVEMGDSDMAFKPAHVIPVNPDEAMEENLNHMNIIEPEAQMQDSNQDDGSNTLPNKKESIAFDTDTSTPRSKIANAGEGSRKGYSSKRRKTMTNEVAESIRFFADSILKLEQAKMEMFKDSERLRAEMEMRRTEMELKRTEIIAKTQLQIAKLLSGKKTKRKPTNKNTILKPPTVSSAATATATAAPYNGTASGMQE
eukprot:TRINITY_DN5057_c0_g1_i1.p1 TRINITY_DN5057_c0_g1~~TRINITY_DN5057_c0_g1_i1.p1  ORF type:complete len:383 (+),score=102.51 TRINITY_DN5057_c0_g1_i1:330-1478(+)